jgi:hypothetical protein
MHNKEELIKRLSEVQWEIKGDLVQACCNEIENKQINIFDMLVPILAPPHKPQIINLKVIK